MTESPAQFAREANGLSDGQVAPSEWATVYGETDIVQSFAACSETGQKLHVLAVSVDATAVQQEAFERARSAWLTHANSAVIVPVVAHGTDPRPWLAIEPIRASTVHPVRPEQARSIMIDLAEAFWLIESADESLLTGREGLQLDLQKGTARVCWPLTAGAPSRAAGVAQVGALGYELLTGADPPRTGPLDWPGDEQPPQLWYTIESALTDGSPASCYELKRALLFGPVTPPPMSPAQQPPPPDSDQPEGSADSRGLSKQISRRATVGVLGLSALGVTGLFARGSETASSDSAADEGPPEASFRFEQGRTTMTVTHAGGDDIEASQLTIRNTRISGTGTYRWTDFEGYGPETTVSEGDSIVVDRGVLSMWYASVVWVSPDEETEIVLEERSISEEDLYS